MATTLLADGRAADVADMVEPLLDPVKAPAASTGQILLRGLMARVEIAHRDHLDEGLALLPEPEDVHDLCTCVRAEVALWRGWAHARRPAGETTRALRLLEESRKLFATINDPLGRCWALLGRAQAYFAIDEYALMRPVLDDGAALLDHLRETQAKRWLHELRIRALRFEGRYDEAEEHVQALRTIATDWEDRRVRAYAAAHTAALLYDRGEPPSTIIEQAETAVSLFRQVDHCTAYPLVAAFHAHVGALCRRGSWDEAVDVIETAETTLPADPVARAHLRTLRARNALRRGDSDTAYDLLEDLLDQAYQLPHGLQRSHVALLYGQILADRNRLEEAEPWIRRAHRNACETGHRGNQVRTLLSLAQLAAVQGRPDSARSHLDAAENYEDFFQMLPHAMRRFAVEGTVAQAAGDSAEAHRSLQLARSAASLIGDQPREVTLRRILGEFEDRESPFRASVSRTGFGMPVPEVDRDVISEPTDGAPSSEKSGLLDSAEPFDSSFSARLARATLSVPLVAETCLEEVESLLPEANWTGLFRVSGEDFSLIREHGSPPEEIASSDPESKASANESVEWISIPGRGTVEAYALGIEMPDAPSRPQAVQDAPAQIQPWLSVLGLALEQASARTRPSSPAPDFDPAAVSGFVAESSEMQAVAAEIRRIRPSHSPVLITGKRGTGKGLVARVIHETSERAGGPLERVSCAPTQTEEPLETRLFGAVNDEGSWVPGAVHAAEGGTLLLEDIDALPLSLQSSLLHLLDTGRATPPGGAEARPADVRIIATTTADLDARVQEGRFRDALRNHLRVISLHVPPLRKRRADIPLLTRHFLNTHRSDESTLVSVTQPAREALLRYHWPGNVRQLRNEIDRALVHVQSEPAPTIGLDLLSDPVVENARRVGAPQTPEDEPDAILEPDQSLSDVLSRTEKTVIERVLRACDGQITASADVLGLTRQGLYKKMKRLDIDASAFQSSSEPAPASS